MHGGMCVCIHVYVCVCTYAWRYVGMYLSLYALPGAMAQIMLQMHSLWIEDSRESFLAIFNLQSSIQAK